MSTDEPQVLVPVADLETLLDAAEKADEAGLLGDCEVGGTGPCPVCAALANVQQAIWEATR